MAQATAWWAINLIATEGIGTARNSMRALSALHGLSRISDTDFSKLTHKEQLDQYARQAADITKVVLLNKALDKLVPGLKTNTSVSSEPASSRATAENPIAVTPEGVPVKVAPEKAPDTSVLKNAQEVKKPSNANPKIADDIPSFIKENRVPKDEETILRNLIFKRVKGDFHKAAIYEKDGLYYYRDKFHTGNKAHLEVFNRRGIHLGEADPLTGELIAGTADPRKTLDLK